MPSRRDQRRKLQFKCPECYSEFSLADSKQDRVDDAEKQMIEIISRRESYKGKKKHGYKKYSVLATRLHLKLHKVLDPKNAKNNQHHTQQERKQSIPLLQIHQNNTKHNKNNSDNQKPKR